MLIISKIDMIYILSSLISNKDQRRCCLKILNFGSMNIDKTYSLEHIVRPGETVNSIKYEEFIGGKGLNQSVALAYAGAEVWHAGLVGKLDGLALVDRLNQAGVNTSLIESRDNSSGHALIQIDQNGMNSIIVEGGTNTMIDEIYIDKVLENFEEGDMLLIQNEISSLPYLVNRAYEKNMTIAINPSPMDEKVLAIDLDKITYFLVNEIEAMTISKTLILDQALDILVERFPNSKVIMTLGSEGAIYKDKDTFYKVAGKQVDVVDTTGAGDTFCGYFLASLSKGLTIQICMDIANTAASISCTKKGASNSIPRINELELGL